MAEGKEVTNVTIVPSMMTSYATALRAHLSATLAYMRVDDYESAEAELDCIYTCADVIRTGINQQLYS